VQSNTWLCQHKELFPEGWRAIEFTNRVYILQKERRIRDYSPYLPASREKSPGKVVVGSMKKQRLNPYIEDVEEELRLQGFISIASLTCFDTTWWNIPGNDELTARACNPKRDCETKCFGRLLSLPTWVLWKTIPIAQWWNRCSWILLWRLDFQKHDGCSNSWSWSFCSLFMDVSPQPKKLPKIRLH